MWNSEYFDGKTSRSRNVHASVQNGQLVITGETEITRWNEVDMHVLRDDATLIRIENKVTDERLHIADIEALGALQMQFPSAFETKLVKKDWRKLILWGGGAVVSLGLIIFVLLPKLTDYLAVAIPREREVEMGRKLIGSLEGGMMSALMGDMRQCENEAGLAAMDTMLEKLSNGRDLDYDIELYVVSSEESNAFTFPGGQIVFLNGLIQNADNASEVAGVLAHEIGHAEARDPLRIMLGSLGRSSILSIMIGDISGGIFAYAAVDSFVNAAYSQGAEAQADEYAIEMLNESGIGTEGFASFFNKLGEMVGDENTLLSHFSSHPQLAERAENAKAKGSDSSTGNILSGQEWSALRDICKDVPELSDEEKKNILDNLKERFEIGEGQN